MPLHGYAPTAVPPGFLCPGVWGKNRRRTLALCGEGTALQCGKTVVWDSVPLEILGESQVTGIKVRNVVTGSE